MSIIKTAKEIYDSMAANYEKTSGKSLYGDSDMALRMYAAAAEAESLYAYNEWIMKQCFPQTAEGEFLDRHAVMRGITRKSADKAKGSVRFYIENIRESDVEIPEGTVCLTGAGTYFETVESGAVKAGDTYCDVAVQARDAGADGNVAANTVIFMTEPPVGISGCVNEGNFSGGSEAESDDALRERVLAAYKTLPNGANKAYYEKTVSAVDGVGSVLVLPKNRGIGTVDVIVTATDGVPSQELIDKVSEKLNSVREICVDISVSAPETVEIAVAASVDAEEGYSFDEVKAAVENALSDYFSGCALGKNVTVAHLGNVIYSVDGVKNYRITSPAEDIECGINVLPVSREITISEWGQ